MHYFLLLTDECNLCCKYCRGKMFFVPDETPDTVDLDCNLPCELSFSLDHLYEFLSKDKDAVLTFYGGEPLLKKDLICEIMDNAPVKKYIIQTNGTLLDSLPAEYVNSFCSIFVSIDGDRQTTDLSRGKGTYDRVIRNLKHIKNNRFENEIIARMTVSEKNDIFNSVKYLSSNPDFSFDSVHWQMDCNFWSDFELRDGISEWLYSGYNPGIRRLADLWIKIMREEGRVMMWYPFVDTMQDLLFGMKNAPLRCGSGFANYSILQDGNIAPCPCMAGMKDYYCGNIKTGDPGRLRKIDISGDCRKCDIRNFCGGRCLYSNIINPWPKTGRKMVCDTVRNLRYSIEKKVPEVLGLIKKGVISIRQFEHEKYNGCEIIP
ncbi:putative peptide-modifying radical SAM enzyme [Methanomicrobium sp. W14]|uniref:TIGR04084 family radical SAM/SPASM domain-containing protein n=1 Tax=Methanomicrobium sp. W14 TaxID=2817839 RepID=UPI001AE10B51|nr:TIGR04084 family radical SAM/SPASM domain-containing protein [Methanomicrobium sp. W14]MBP2133000.1 putative peptide-modifying radical SAM enzyme [Methanomicrobium sp. W14]